MIFQSKCCGYSGRFLYSLSWGCALLCLCIASYLTVNPKTSDIFQRPIQPLALNSSPYGMLLSSLLQQPMNVEWHKGIEIHEAKHEDGHEHSAKKTAEKSAHHHAEGDHCEVCDIAAGRFGKRSSEMSLLNRFSKELEKLTRINTTRTNPNPISPRHKLYIAQNIEKKMLIAYNLDPANFAAYDAYFLFLTENPVSGLGNANQLKQAQLITKHTLELSAREQINPLPSITAALATFNIFMLNFVLEKPQDHAFNQMLYTKVSEHLAKYQRLKAVAENEGSWEQVPDAWRFQADQRATLLQKVAKGLVEKPVDKVSK